MTCGIGLPTTLSNCSLSFKTLLALVLLKRKRSLNLIGATEKVRVQPQTLMRNYYYSNGIQETLKTFEIVSILLPIAVS